MSVLCLDLGTKTGAAIFKREDFISEENNSSNLLSGFVTTQLINTNGKPFKRCSNRFYNFEQTLDAMHQEFNIYEVWFESVIGHKGVHAAHMYGGFEAILSSWCYKNMIPCAGVHLATIKKHITGRGNARKEEVISCVRKRGYDVKDDNVADALSLLLYVIETGAINENSFVKNYRH